MSVRADVETFRGIPIFSDCDAVHLQLLAFSSGRDSFEAGATVVSEGQKGAAAHLILSGHVDLSTKDGGRLGSAGPGALLGEVAMIGDSAYAITAVATDTVTTARIDRELFLRVAREFPEFGTAVFRSLSRKLDASLRELDSTRPVFENARSFRSL
jgi:CRP-like cAMP-binding protein